MIGPRINLARAPERWVSMARSAAGPGLAVERIETVDWRAWTRIAAGGAPFGLAHELARVWRRIVPAQPALNLLRPEAERLALRRIAFDG